MKLNWKKILDAIIPISKERHDLEMLKERQSNAKALAAQAERFDRRLSELIEPIAKLAENLTSIKWLPDHGFDTFAVQMSISGQMMQYAEDSEKGKEIITNVLADQFRAEIKRSKFLVNNTYGRRPII